MKTPLFSEQPSRCSQFDWDIPYFFNFRTTLGWLMPRNLAISRVDLDCINAVLSIFDSVSLSLTVNLDGATVR